MELKKSMAVVEAILFASGEPVAVQRLAEALETDIETVHNLVTLLNDRYREQESGIVVCIAGRKLPVVYGGPVCRLYKKSLGN